MHLSVNFCSKRNRSDSILPCSMETRGRWERSDMAWKREALQFDADTHTRF